jgi:hypothetical protein
MNVLFFLVLYLCFLSAFAQHNSSCNHSHECHHKKRDKNDTTIKILHYHISEDQTTEAYIIERYREDPLADEWLNNYITKERHKRIHPALKGLKSSLCSNLDFEMGNFTGWTCKVGTNNGYPAGGWSGSLLLTTDILLKQAVMYLW